MELMKNGLAEPAIYRISAALNTVLTKFDQSAFINDCLNGLGALELKERVDHIIDVLHQYLPTDFAQTADCLMAIPAIWDHGDENDPLRSFAAWPIIDYIAKHGIEQPNLALQVLKTLTCLFSAEFAIRPFILKYPELCHQNLASWSKDEDYHVRRLVSEGTRPRLPWGIRLPPFVKDPSPCLGYLDQLKDDEQLYVRRSVANHLNDIAKDHPDIVITTCKQWLAEVKNKPSTDLQWLIKHATRTVVKQGHPEVFSLLGFTNKPKVDVKLNIATPTVVFGNQLEFELTLTSKAKKSQKFVLDYAVHFVKANGETSPKVFKLKNMNLAAGETTTLAKKQAIKPITTRKYYAGNHKVEVFINGESKLIKRFELKMD